MIKSRLNNIRFVYFIKKESVMEDRVKTQFVECFGIEADMVVDSFEYGSIPQWDSVAHMSLIVCLEDEFDIMIDIDDVIDMSTFKKAKEIVGKYL
jgi:acyl carrier protein